MDGEANANLILEGGALAAPPADEIQISLTVRRDPEGRQNTIVSEVPNSQLTAEDQHLLNDAFGLVIDRWRAQQAAQRGDQVVAVDVGHDHVEQHSMEVAPPPQYGMRLLGRAAHDRLVADESLCDGESRQAQRCRGRA